MADEQLNPTSAEQALPPAQDTAPVATPAPAPAGTLWDKVDEALRGIAYKVAKDNFGLTRGDFVIQYFPWRKHAYKINKFGSVFRCYFGIFPLDKEFEFYLNRALTALAYAVSTKGGKLQLAGDLELSKAELKKLAPHWASLPKLAPNDELEITEVYKVIVKHKASGLVITKESKQPKFGPMIIDARIEMAENLDAVDRFKEKK